ncbi:shikimate kinase AroK [Candidatus Legionella polyplacis]|uniref:Shikimate kinase n=1 Tax=Candidatus Legionella polyplacis TaxID=2005262 RepID=A0ABZ2GXN3_9GAMM
MNISIKIRNIFLIGPIGSGKSTIGKILAKELKFEFYDSDTVLKKRTGADISWILDIEGIDGFRKREKKIIEELTKKTNIVLATGEGSVTITENQYALTSRGTVIYLKTSLQEQYERTKKDSKHPLLRAKNIKNQLKILKKEREPIYIKLSDIIFETDKLTTKTVSNNIIKYLYNNTL